MEKPGFLQKKKREREGRSGPEKAKGKRRNRKVAGRVEQWRISGKLIFEG